MWWFPIIFFLFSVIHARKQTCVANRQLCVSSVVNGTSVDFFVTFTTPGWVSFGLSPSGSMANADVAMIWTQDVPGRGKAILISDRTSTSRSVPSSDKEQNWNVILAQTIRNTPNAYAATIRRLINTNDAVDQVFKNEVQKYIWALSTVPMVINDNRPTFNIHTEFGTFDHNALESTSLADELQTNDVNPLISRNLALFIHAILMALAWGVLSFIGAFVARFLKDRLKVAWFPIHWVLMSLVAGLSLVALIVMYLAIGHRWFASLHALVGTSVVCAMCFQILLGVIIDQMYDKDRQEVPFRDMAHRVIGYILALGGPAAIGLGLLHIQAGFILYAALAGTFVSFLILFSLGELRRGKKNVPLVITHRTDWKEEANKRYS